MWVFKLHLNLKIDHVTKMHLLAIRYSAGDIVASWRLLAGDNSLYDCPTARDEWGVGGWLGGRLATTLLAFRLLI